MGRVDRPIGIIKRGEIPSYLDEEFWSAYHIWNNTRLTGRLPYEGGWAEIPYRLTEIITAFQNEYEKL